MAVLRYFKRILTAISADAPSWYEALSCQLSSLPALIYSSAPDLIKHFQKQGSQINFKDLDSDVQYHHFGCTSFSLNAPIHSYHNFTPSINRQIFFELAEIGHWVMFGFYSDGVFSAFVRNVTSSKVTSSIILRSETFYAKPESVRRIISILYNKFTQEGHSQLPVLQTDWEFDLDVKSYIAPTGQT